MIHPIQISNVITLYLPYVMTFAHLLFCRCMPLLIMLQEIHCKLMRMMRVNKEYMLGNDLPVRPKVKIKLDIAIKNSRKWHVTWHGLTIHG